MLSAEATRHTPLPTSTQQEGREQWQDQQQMIEGGFLGGGEQLVWRTLGPTVEVLEASSGTRVAAWTFGSVLKSTTAKVSEWHLYERATAHNDTVVSTYCYILCLNRHKKRCFLMSK